MDKLLQKALQSFKSLENYNNFENKSQLDQVAMASPWLCEWLKKHSDWPAQFEFFLKPAAATNELDDLASHWSIDNEAGVMLDLRVWRNRHIARLIARDALGLSSARETAAEVSDLADAAVAQAARWSELYWQSKQGIPGLCPYSNKPQQLHVIAMGKHGAGELNLSSDIDLIFAYPSEEVTQKGVSHEQYFTRVGRKIIHLLDARTAEGFAFRVDMRLRPWGQSGALASNFNALNNYYLQQGRFWERFAMVKARPITGSKVSSQALEDMLQPFVYRRYVDFQAVGALRELKGKIQQEVRRQNSERNIKLGQGGIREVEFIAQVFQLVRGGQDEVLQTRGTWPALSLLAELGLLPESAVNELIEAYDFLRDLEHKIQALNDQQTQMLPVDEGELERLAANMGQASVEQLLELLALHRVRVNMHFSQVIADDDVSEQFPDIEPLHYAWCHQLEPKGINTNLALTEQILAFASDPTVLKLKGDSKLNLDKFMPMLWHELMAFENGAQRFVVIRPILEAILRRSSYFVLLSENPSAIRELVKLTPLSPWIVNQLKEKPFLLDELTDLKSLYQLPRQAELQDELHQLLLRVPEDDLERQMEALRHFRHGRVLRAAACEVTNQLPLMKISDYLAWVAEVVVDQALALVWRQMISKHGRPLGVNGEAIESAFGAIAYGKMGGLEVSYESDLDLVFLHNADTQGQTEGPVAIDNVVFMARLGQKLIHILNSVTPSGMLYEVDTRLRPSGSSGLLVSSIASFDKYQHSDAWTWEHQALVRARFIAGESALKEAFDQVRKSVLCQKRDLTALRKDIIDMRIKMSEHLSTKESSAEAAIFDIKQDAGGIVDLEFLVQYLVLAYSHDHPELTAWSDNVRCIGSLAQQGLLTEHEQVEWMEAYLALRAEVHHAILQNESRKRLVSELPTAFLEATKVVLHNWQEKIVSPVQK